MSDDRRGFLKKGLLGGALLSIGGASFLALRGGRQHTPPSPLLVMNAASYSIMVAVAEVVLAFEGSNPIDAAFRVDQSLSFAPARVQSEVQDALMLLENGLAGLFTRGQTRPFSTLSIEDRGAALNRWRDSNVTLLRSAYHAVRKLALAGHYSSMSGAKETGYPGPPFEKGPLWEMEARKPISPAFVVTPPTEAQDETNGAPPPPSPTDAAPAATTDGAIP